MPYRLLADAVLVIHVAVIAFNLGGLVLIVLGNRVGWQWVNAWWFRLAHLASIGIVVAQAWLGQRCPLTTLESSLRRKAGLPTYAESFVQHWLHRVIFYDLPDWVFTVAYTLFGALVLVAWWFYPPGRRVGEPSP